MNAKKVAVIMGSDSDWPILKPAVELLKQFGIAAEVTVASAHRTPAKVRTFVESAPEKGVAAFIVGAGAAAHLAGVVASYTTLPVIGVPVNSTSLGGMDALLSIAQMPAGIPVACMAINGAKNAGLFAAQILSTSSPSLQRKFRAYRKTMAEQVEKKAQKLAAKLEG